MSTMTVTNSGLNLLRDATKGANNAQITYVALGVGNTAPSASDTTLNFETFRKAVTSATNGANPGEVIISMYMSPSDGIGLNIQELAIFGGNSASSTANTGIMLARGLYSHSNKLSTEALNFQIDLTV